MSSIPTMDAERLFLELLPRIERVIGAVCRRNGWQGDDAEEFAAHVKLKLIEDDYATLRKFRGDSKLPTFLTIVVENLFRDFRIAKWGKWRPSAAALEMGVAAVELERLIDRDGRSVEEAVETVAAHGTVRTSRRRLREIADLLPVRNPRRFEDEGALERLPGTEGADERVEDAERRRTSSRLADALGASLRTLEPEDRVILKLRFWDGFTVRRIADTLHLEQRPLYRRVERLLRDLKQALDAAGLDAADVDRVVGRREGMLVRVPPPVEKAPSRPSQQVGRDS